MKISLPENSLEFFHFNGEFGFARNDNQFHPWNEIKSSELDVLSHDLEKYPEKIAAMETAGIHDGIAQLKQFAECVHGDLNQEPDYINSRNNQNDNEYSPCEHRGTGNCQFKEIICEKGTYNAPCGKLSRREIEVMNAIQQGHTDNEIAQKLFISVNTVKTHVSHIGGKIGTICRNSRAAIAAYTVRHNLC